MILLIPELRLLDGKCLLKIKGNEDTEPFDFSDDPIKICYLLRKENAKSIHITLDDKYITEIHLNQVIELSKSVDIPFQISAKFADLTQCEYLLNNNVFRICLPALSDIHSNDIHDLILKYTPSRFVAALEVSDSKLTGKNAYHISIEDVLHQLKDIGFQRILYRDDGIIKNNKTYDLEFLSNLSSQSGLKMTIYNGIKRAEDLWKLNEYVKSGIDSVVLGDALYNNYFPCQQIWRMAESVLDLKI